MGWIVLAVYLAALAPACWLVWRRPAVALYAFVVGLVLHNTVSLLLFAAGAGGRTLTVVQSWKETLLAVALVRVGRDALRGRALPFRPAGADVAALVFTGVVVAYALIPQDLLGGEAGPKAELYGLRHYVLPVAAYLVGRALPLRGSELRVALVLSLGVAVVAALAGIAEQYLVSVEAWRDLGAAAYFGEQLGFPEHRGPAGLPENFVFNSSEGVLRRLVSFFLSPLGSAYFFAVVLCLAGARAIPIRGGLVLVGSAAVFAGLLFSLTRSAILALGGAFAVVAGALRTAAAAGIAVLVLAAGFGFVAAFPDFGPRTHFLAEDLAYQEQRAAREGELPDENPLGSGIRLSDPSARSHLAELERGGRSLVDHPQGHGLGNSGQTALRFGVPLQAGESYYLELGADAGLGGLLVWLTFVALLLAGLIRRARAGSGTPEGRLAAGALAGLAALSAVAVISDPWGTPWVVYVLWWLVGSALTTEELRGPTAASLSLRGARG